MKCRMLVFIFVVLLVSSLCHAGFLDNLLKGPGLSGEKETDENTMVSGLKEALSIGTEKAVSEVSSIDGYLANEAIKIMMPDKIKKVADVLKKVGYQKEVDDFVISMNRAAERAAPKAAPLFSNAIKRMTFDDAKKILNGDDTAATDYFETETSDKLYEAFKPIVSSSMNKVGVTKSYKKMIGKYTSLPFMKEESLDLDHYVTDKAMDGLFYKIAQEEKKIRTDPAARLTKLLKKVFGK